MARHLFCMKYIFIAVLSVLLFAGCEKEDNSVTDYGKLYTERLTRGDGRWGILDMSGYYNDFQHIDESEEWSGIPHDDDRYGDFIFYSEGQFQTVRPGGSKIVMEGLWRVEDKSLVLEYVDKEEVKKVVDRFDIVSLGVSDLILKQQYKNDTCEYVNIMKFKFSSDMGYTDDDIINYGSRWFIDDATGFYKDLENPANDKNWSGAPQPGYEFGNFIFMDGNSFTETEIGGYEMIAEGDWNLNGNELKLEYKYRNNSDKMVETFKVDTLTDLKLILSQETSDDKHEYKNVLTYRKSAMRSAE